MLRKKVISLKKESEKKQKETITQEEVTSITKNKTNMEKKGMHDKKHKKWLLKNANR